MTGLLRPTRRYQLSPFFTICAATALIWALCGCSSSNGSGAGSSVDDLNPKVVNAVAPLSGSSTLAASWLVDQWVNLSAPSIKSCLTGLGRTDLLSESLDHVRSSAFAYHVGIGPYFRNLDSIAANGFFDTPDDPLDSMFDAEADPTGKIVVRCTEQYRATGAEAAALNKSDQIRQLNVELTTAWNKEIDVVTASREFEGTYERFAKCMETKGVSAGDVKDFHAFDTFLDGLVQRDGKQGAASMRVATNYASCRAAYDNELAALLEGKRPTFLQDHLDQVEKLSELVESS